MKHLKFAIVFTGLFIICTTACNQPAADKAPEANSDSNQTITAKADPAKMKADIQAMETAWSNNARDVKALAAFYADDAVSFVNNQPMLVGNAAIRKDKNFYGKKTQGFYAFV